MSKSSASALGGVVVVAIIVIFVVLGVGKGTPGDGPPGPIPVPKSCDEDRQACRKLWTVLIYMAADNEDMPPFAYWHLNEMEARLPDGTSASTSASIDVLVQLDLPDDGVRRLQVVPGDVSHGDAPPNTFVSPVIDRLDDENVAPASSFSEFLDWGVRNYPSEHYFVVVWGHGQGWRPATTQAESVRYKDGDFVGGIAFDHSQGTVLDIPSLAGAMAKVSRERMGGRKFDVYASDACLMQTVAVAHQLSSVADYVVGSEQIEDYSGLPYRALIPELTRLDAGPGCGWGDRACAVAGAVPAIYERAVTQGQYAQRAPDARRHFTVATVRTSALQQELVPALDELGAALQAYNDEDPTFHALQLLVLLGPRGIPDFLGGTRDLGVLARVVETDLERTGPTPAAELVKNALNRVRGAMSQAVVAFEAGEEYDTPGWEGMTGISVWLPHDRVEHDARIDAFSQSRFFNDAPRWGPWIGSSVQPQGAP